MLHVGQLLGILVLLPRLSGSQELPEMPGSFSAARRERGCASGFGLSRGGAHGYPRLGHRKPREETGPWCSAVIRRHGASNDSWTYWS